MSIHVNKTIDIPKIMAFIRAAAKGEFQIPHEKVEEVLKALLQYAKEQGISIDIVTPTGEKLLTFSAFGTLAGVGVGFAISGVPGAFFGALIGCGLGYCASHVTIVIDRSSGRDDVMMSIH